MRVKVMRKSKFNRGSITLEISSLSPEKILNILWKRDIDIIEVKKISITTILLTINYSYYKEVEELTLRKFTSLLRVADAKLNYLAYKIGEMSGLVTFKTPFPHWIYTKENARQSLLDNIMTFDQVQKKIGEGGVTE